MISGMNFRKTPACDTSLPLEHYLFRAYLVARARVVDWWFWQSSVAGARVASNDTNRFERHHMTMTLLIAKSFQSLFI